MNQQKTKVNEFERMVPYDLKSLDELRIVESSNKVLVQINVEDTEYTVGGIYTEGLKPFSFANGTARRGKVVRTCKTIIPGRSGIDFMLWDTDVEIQEGDEVFMNYFDLLNTYTYRYEGMILKLVPYSSIILANRKDKVVMCNGYVLLEKVEEEIGFGKFKKKIDKPKEGIVKYTGSANKRHLLVIKPTDLKKYRLRNPDSKIYARGDDYLMLNNPNRNDVKEEDIDVGDHVFIGDVRWQFDLEVFAYARFEDRKVYKVCPRHAILAKFDS